MPGRGHIPELRGPTISNPTRAFEGPGPSIFISHFILTQSLSLSIGGRLLCHNRFALPKLHHLSNLLDHRRKTGKSHFSASLLPVLTSPLDSAHGVEVFGAFTPYFACFSSLDYPFIIKGCNSGRARWQRRIGEKCFSTPF